MTQAAETVQLSEETLMAYSKHIGAIDAAMERALNGDVPFLWSEGSDERMRNLCIGQTIAALWEGKHPIAVPNGLIHDWIGATRVNGTTLEKTVALIQDYDNHKSIYKPEVVDSRLVSRSGDDFRIYLRLLKKKIISVVLDTDHDVRYTVMDSSRLCCRSSTTRISQIEDAGKPTEQARPPDTGYGFLWRLHSYWRFQQLDANVIIECRAVSLTRDVPKGLGWILEPIIAKLPGDSLRATLDATRRALSSTPLATAVDASCNQT